jgi:predicted branched-subunit amino acid permease
MDAALGPILSALLKMGAPWVITAVFIVLFWTERKQKDQLADKLYELGMAMTKTNTEFSLTLRKVERDIDDIRRHDQ